MSHAEPSAQANAIGSLVEDKYEIVSCVGRGAMAVVYKAIQLPIRREVILKVLQPNRTVLEGDPNFAERFRREAATYGRLRHPNTVVMYETGQSLQGDRPLYYMVLEYVEGRTVRQLIEDQRFVSPDLAIEIALQVCGSLREAHGLGIVHRDLKPNNLMISDLDGTPHVKVLDFGIAQVTNYLNRADTQLTQSGILLGTPHYMAPEQIRSTSMDHRVDIYALGCILVELLTGSPPYRGTSSIEICAAHLTKPIPSLEQVAGHRLLLPPGLEPVIQRCLQKEPGDRYRDVDELIGALKSLRMSSEVMSISTLHRFSGTGPHQILRSTRPPEIRSGRWPLFLLSTGLLMLGVLTAAAGSLVLAVLVSSSSLLQEPARRPREAALEVPIPEMAMVTAPEPATPAPPHEIVSVPTGAHLWVDGVDLGPTPLTLESARASQASEIVVRAPGFRDHAVPPTALLSATQLEVRLQPAPRAQPASAPDSSFQPVIRGAR